MKLLVGLGNPGDRYLDTRHNVGFRFLDALAQHEGFRFNDSPRFRAETATHTWGSQKVLLAKPLTFMNNSGEAIGALARYHQVPPEQIIVVYDDLDLAKGKFRIKKGGGHGGHNGLRSLNQHLETSDYIRVKVGIGRPEHGSVTDWVLGKADNNQRIIEKHIFDALQQRIPLLLSGEINQVSSQIQPDLQALVATLQA